MVGEFAREGDQLQTRSICVGENNQRAARPTSTTTGVATATITITTTTTTTTTRLVVVVVVVLVAMLWWLIC